MLIYADCNDTVGNVPLKFGVSFDARVTSPAVSTWKSPYVITGSIPSSVRSTPNEGNVAIL